jgi:hypothetical protein
MSDLKIFNEDALEYPTYIIILNKHKLRKIMGAWLYKLKKDLLIQNDIYIMLDDYQHRNNPRLLFYNNDKKYKTVYKKFNLNDKALYIPIEEYSKYYLTLKTKICTSILETLGVKSIEFKHNEFTHNILNVDLHTTISNINFNTHLSNEEKDKYTNDDTKIYNKGHCKYLFCEPTEFERKIKDLNSYIMDELDFNNDLELRNLIRSRLVGNLIEYDLKYEIDFMSSIEVDLSASFTNSDNAGINIKKYANKKLNVNLHIKFYKYSELINNDNIVLKEKCLQLLVNYDNNNEDIDNIDTTTNIIIDNIQQQPNTLISQEAKNDIRQINKKINLLHSFIDRYMEENASDKLQEYKMIKIADPKYINNLINGVKTMEDLSKNGVFLNSFSSLVYTTLLPFDDEGLNRIQKIYTWLKRHNYQVEMFKIDLTSKKNDNICYNLRCSEPDCNNPIKSVRIVFCYIVRVYNHENEHNILTYGLETSKELNEVLRYIAMNLKHLTNYKMFTDFARRYINLFRCKYEPGFNDVYKIDTLGNVIDTYTKEASKIGSGLYTYVNSLFYTS